LIAATALTIAVYGMEATLLGTILPALSKTLTPSQSGTLAGVQSIGLIVASFATGPALDRAGRKTGLVSGLALVSLALLLLTRVTTYIPLLLVLGLLGLGGGILSTSTNTMASDLGGKSQASLMNLLNCFFGLGGLLTPALGAFLTIPALCVVIVALAAGTVLLHLSNTMPQRDISAPTDVLTVKGLLARPVFLLLSLFLFLYVAAELGVWNWFPTYLTGRGVARPVALRILSFGFAAGIISGRLAAPRILLRLRPATVILAASILMLVTTFAMLQVSGTLAAGVTVFLAGLAMAPVYPTTLALVGEAFPTGTATAIGITVTCGWIGVAFSSQLIGSLAGQDPASLGHALLVIPAFSALMVLVSFGIRSIEVTKKRDPGRAGSL
jgi:fucose permease